MTYVIAQDGTAFGPFTSVQVLADRLACDAVVLPLSVIGTFTTTQVAPGPTAAQLATIAEAQRVAAIDATIQGDTTIAQLKAMNNADFDAWWTANVTTLAQASVVLKRIARVVLRRVL